MAILKAIPTRARDLLFLGLLVRLVFAWLPEKYLFYLVYDDAYYYFSIARNLIERGMLSADGIHLTNGFHPLWLFVITPIYLLFGHYHWLSIHLVLTVSAFLDTGAALLIYKTLERMERPKAGFWAAAFYLFNPVVLQYTMSGLETALNSFLLALLVCLSVKANFEWLKTGWLTLGTVCGFALLSRTDNLFAVAALFAYLFWRDRNVKTLLKTAAIAGLLALPWLGYNWAAFGTIIQTSGNTFPWLYHQQYLNEHNSYFSWALVPYALKAGFYNFALYAFHYGNWILTLAVATVLVYQLKKEPQRFRPFWWALTGAALFITAHFFIRWSVRPWYPQTVFVLALPAIVLALEKVNRYVFGLGTTAVLYFASLPAWSPSYFRRIDQFPKMLEVAQKLPPHDRIGSFNCGYLQYFTDQKVINLDGFVNNEVLSFYKGKKGLEYLRRQNVRWLVDYELYYTSIFGPYFGADTESSLVGVGVVSDPVVPKNTVLIAAVLPESLRPKPSQRITIWHDWAFRRQWGPFPWPSLKRI